MKSAAPQAFPRDLVLTGHIFDAYGLKGWVKIRPYSKDAGALFNARTWWIKAPSEECYRVQVQAVKFHGDDVVAKLLNISDRNAAKDLRGSVIEISRSSFPSLNDDEFYWVDLIGLFVENQQGEFLGTVHAMMDNGAHAILQVRPLAGDDEKISEILIPFVDPFVGKVDHESKKIIVDWAIDNTAI